MGTDPFNADFPTGSPANQVIPASSPTSRTTILPACRRTCPGPSHGRVGDRQPFPHMRATCVRGSHERSEEHTSELQSLMRISYAVFCLKKKIKQDKVSS